MAGEEEQQAILHLPRRAFQAERGRDFVRLGEHVDHSCFILDGLTARFSQSSDALRQIMALQIRGDMADLPSVVLPRAASALQALTTTAILRSPIAPRARWRSVFQRLQRGLARLHDRRCDHRRMARQHRAPGRPSQARAPVL